jgi:2-keto-4-pentenoate hydratase/2-oxohepta-3-ene-1,7-dioic acid hydratase in catechol pathway
VEAIADPFVAAHPRHGDPSLDVATLARTSPGLADGPSGALARHRLAPPVPGGKLLCVGRNYRAHAEEMGNAVPEDPILFFKPASSLLAAGDPLDLPRGFERIDMESELVAVIGRTAKDVAEDDALAYVAGYTLGNDVSCRDLQRADKQWTRGKGFDGFAPCGPFVRIAEAGVPLPPTTRIRGFVDDELVQDAPIGDMLFPLPFVIAYVSRVMTLEPGDLVYTGTPAGVAALSPGRVVRVEVAGVELGRLVTPVR